MNRHSNSPLANLPGMDSVSPGELSRLDALTTIVRADTGTVLMRQGAFGNEALILIEGELLVQRDGEAIAVLSPGHVVGEQAILLNAPRNATVTAATDVVVAAMNRREFSSVLDACPELARLFLTTAVARAGAAAN